MAFVLLLIIFALILPGDLPKYCATHSMPFHQACVENLPRSLHPEFYASILCGERSPGCSELEGLVILGLVHLTIVTGHHFRFFDHIHSALESLWQRVCSIPYPFARASAVGSALSLFAMTAIVVGAGSPPFLIRAWVDFVLQRINRFWRLGWRPVPRIAMSGSVSLALCRSSFDVQLLLFGWVAALAFGLSSSFTQCMHQENKEMSRVGRVRAFEDFDKVNVSRWVKRQIQSGTFLYLFLLPLFWRHGWPSHLLILTNALLAPLFGAVLLPMAVAFSLLPSLREWIDLSVGHWLRFANFLGEFIPPEEFTQTHALPFRTSEMRLWYVLALSCLTIWVDSLFHHPPEQKRATG